MYVVVYGYVHVSEGPMEASRGHQIPWSWIYRAAILQLGFFARAVCSLNCCAISPDLHFKHFEVQAVQQALAYLQCVTSTSNYRIFPSLPKRISIPFSRLTFWQPLICSYLSGFASFGLCTGVGWCEWFWHGVCQVHLFIASPSMSFLKTRTCDVPHFVHSLVRGQIFRMFTFGDWYEQ